VAVVVPTVLASSPDEFKTTMDRAAGLSDRIHVDICDGQFADAKTVDLAQVYAPDNAKLDLHLMVDDPTSVHETALSLKPELIIFHAESQGDVGALIEKTRQLGVKAGLAILPQTKLEDVETLLAKVDHALIFTGHLGHNGGQFQTQQLERAAAIKNSHPEVEVSVDGGVSDKNAALITLQGVDVLFVGGFLQNSPDPQAAFDSIRRQIGDDV
jgi:ribulose-phosphate 3-epimerase